MLGLRLMAKKGLDAYKEAGFIYSYHDEKSFLDSLRKMIKAPVNGYEVFKAYSDFFSLEASVNRLKTFLTKEHLLDKLQ